MGADMLNSNSACGSASRCPSIWLGASRLKKPTEDVGGPGKGAPAWSRASRECGSDWWVRLSKLPLSTVLPAESLAS